MAVNPFFFFLPQTSYKKHLAPRGEEVFLPLLNAINCTAISVSLLLDEVRSEGAAYCSEIRLDVCDPAVNVKGSEKIKVNFHTKTIKIFNVSLGFNLLWKIVVTNSYLFFNDFFLNVFRNIYI